MNMNSENKEINQDLDLDLKKGENRGNLLSIFSEDLFLCKNFGVSLGSELIKNNKKVMHLYPNNLNNNILKKYLSNLSSISFERIENNTLSESDSININVIKDMKILDNNLFLKEIDCSSIKNLINYIKNFIKNNKIDALVVDDIDFLLEKEDIKKFNLNFIYSLLNISQSENFELIFICGNDNIKNLFIKTGSSIILNLKNNNQKMISVFVDKFRYGKSQKEYSLSIKKDIYNYTNFSNNFFKKILLKSSMKKSFS